MTLQEDFWKEIEEENKTYHLLKWKMTGMSHIVNKILSTLSKDYVRKEDVFDNTTFLYNFSNIGHRIGQEWHCGNCERCRISKLLKKSVEDMK